jgi:hypothetical protein
LNITTLLKRIKISFTWFSPGYEGNVKKSLQLKKIIAKHQTNKRIILATLQNQSKKLSTQAHLPK